LSIQIAYSQLAITRLDPFGNSIVLSSGTEQYIADELIIKFKDSVLTKDFFYSKEKKIKLHTLNGKSRKKKKYKSVFDDARLSKYSLEKLGSFNSAKSDTNEVDRIVLLKIDDGADVLATCNELMQTEEVEYATPNYLLQTNNTPTNDPYFYLQTGLEQSSDKDIDVQRAWDFNTGNNQIRVGVIDNGVDYDNPDLGGSFGATAPIVKSGYDYINNDSDPDYTENPLNSHGTECAGIIAALRNNGVGVAGIAGGNGGSAGVQIVALKVGPIACDDGSLKCMKTDKVISAIKDGAKPISEGGYGCHILSNSYGGPGWNESVREAVKYAVSKNVVFVAAKGNENTNTRHFPSDYDANWIISVGAVDESDQKSVWCCGQASNTGNGIDVVAPGGRNTANNVYTTSPNPNTSTPNYKTFSGTSAATPHVAGLAALILSEALDQGRTLHHEDVEGIIKASAKDVNQSTYPGYDDQLGWGRINAGKALEMMNTPWQLLQQSTTGGSIYSSTDWYKTQLNGINGLNNGLYICKRHEVRTTITLPFSEDNNTYVWGRGSNKSTGWSAANPNWGMGFCDVVSKSGNQATLRSFIYEVTNQIGQQYGYFPTSAGSVVFAYSSLYIPCFASKNVTENITSGTPNAPIVHVASSSIIASNTIQSGASAVYSAPTSIRLQSGFRAQNGSNFRVNFGGCNAYVSNSRLAHPESNIELDILSNLEPTHFYRKNVKLFPNPFTDYVTIEFELEEDSDVTLIISDAKGNEISRLLDNSKLIKGINHSNFGKNDLSIGLYFYSIVTNKYILNGKIVKQ